MNLSKLQETVKDRGAWHAADHGVTKSRTRLKRLNNNHCYEDSEQHGIKKPLKKRFLILQWLSYFTKKYWRKSLTIAVGERTWKDVRLQPGPLTAVREVEPFKAPTSGPLLQGEHDPAFPRFAGRELHPAEAHHKGGKRLPHMLCQAVLL